MVAVVKTEIIQLKVREVLEGVKLGVKRARSGCRWWRSHPISATNPLEEGIELIRPGEYEYDH